MARKLSPLQVSITSDKMRDVTSSIDKMSDYVSAAIGPKSNTHSRRNDVLS